MSVGLIVAMGTILLGALGLLFLYLDRREQRKRKLAEEQEKTKRREAEATEKLVEHAERDRFNE